MQSLLTAAFEFVFYAGVLFFGLQFLLGLMPRYELSQVNPVLPELDIPDYDELFETAIDTPPAPLPQMPDPWELPLDETVTAPVAPTGWALPTLLLLPPALEVADQPRPDYSALSIRQLKKLAGERKIPKYSSLTKAQLIARLAA